MPDLQQRALAITPLSVRVVQNIYSGAYSSAPQCLIALCESHERLRAELQGAEILLNENAKRIAELERQLRG